MVGRLGAVSMNVGGGTGPPGKRATKVTKWENHEPELVSLSSSASHRGRAVIGVHEHSGIDALSFLARPTRVLRGHEAHKVLRRLITRVTASKTKIDGTFVVFKWLEDAGSQLAQHA